jgi:hypothetical protein
MKAFAVMVQILTAPIAVITGLGVVFELLKGESLRVLVYFAVAFLFLMLGCILQTLVEIRADLKK